MRLPELIAGTAVEGITGDIEVEISGLAYDAAQSAPGTLFFCVPGRTADGHDFAGEAVSRGTVALVVERVLDIPVPQVRVASTRATMAPLAVRFWRHPSSELRVTGITGTNGKTTTAYLLHRVLEADGVQTGLLGTVKRIVGGVEEEVIHTTPESIDLQATLRRMVAAGDRDCVMEASSHALALDRTVGTSFEVGVFTNLTQDHLDFHADMEDYFLAKRTLFFPRDTADSPPASGVVNADDPFGSRLAEEIRAGDQSRLITFSVSGVEADFRAADVSFDASGSRFLCLGPGIEAEVTIPMPGHFNVENALAAFAAAHLLGVDLEKAAETLARTERVPGRFEPVDEGQPFTVLVDYAHTPDSLENALRAARRITDGRVICVFGCGGDRDREKRPTMGGIAARLSDLCVVTSDNPRSEDPDRIIAEILAGVESKEVEVEPDRKSAIALALGVAGDGDTVLITGKGHEQGQEFRDGRKIPFDDREVAREELRRLGARAA